MNVIAFIETVLTLQIRYPFSVSSWIRAKAHNKTVGGVQNSYHLIGLGMDVILEDQSTVTDFKASALALGIKVINEGYHLHLQPKLI